MFVQESTKSQELNKSTPAVELGVTSIHDAYMLEFAITAKNETGAAVTPTMAQFLNAIEQINVKSDNSRDHYAVSGMDIARRNAMRTPYGLSNRYLDKTFTEVADDASVTCNFVATLNEGDIVALQHNNITLKASLASKIADGFNITDYVIKPTVIELIPQSAADITGKYGANFEYALEPKVYAQEKKCGANTEFMGFMDLPTSTLLQGAMMHWSVAPSQFGLVQVAPARMDITRLSWNTARAKDSTKFGTEMPANVTYFDYASEWTLNNLGKDGRDFSRGDYQFAANTSAETTMRLVSYEQMFPAGAGAISSGKY